MKKILIFCVFMLCITPAFPKTINYSRIDRYARRSPILYDNSNLDKLVEYLVYPYSTDEEIARVILAWIVYHIDYDEYEYNKIQEYQANQNRWRLFQNDIPENDILEIRAGVCADIAQLYQRMGQMAGLDIHVVHGNILCPGQSDNEDPESCKHAWNVVKINGSWEYVDPTWAMGNARELGEFDSLRSYQRAIKKRKKDGRNYRTRSDREIQEKWFLTDKEEMIQTHLPSDSKWQLQKKEITPAKFFGISNQAYKTLQKKKKRLQERQNKFFQKQISNKVKTTK